MTTRPDGSDLIFGGAGTRDRPQRRGTDAPGHGRDADTIVGDNGEHLPPRRRPAHGGTTLPRPSTTTTPTASQLRLLPRAVALLDYTPGGPDFARPLPGMTQAASAAGTATVDVWGADEVHGESGDDTVYAGGGNDVVLRRRRRRRHHRRLGPRLDLRRHRRRRRPRRRRPDLHQPQRHDRAAQRRHRRQRAGRRSRTPGSIQTATIYPTGKLKKTVDLTPFALNPNGALSTTRCSGRCTPTTSIFGGLGDDFLHGGAGDDAISGAEALADVLRANATPRGRRLTGVVETDCHPPVQPRHACSASTPPAASSCSTTSTTRAAAITAQRQRHADQDNGDRPGRGSSTTTPPSERHRRRLGTPASANDGNDVIFGDLGNDWLVGGTGRDTLWGGWGNDLLNADDVADHQRRPQRRARHRTPATRTAPSAAPASTC